jgi:hypothetical protein
MLRCVVIDTLTNAISHGDGDVRLEYWVTSHVPAGAAQHASGDGLCSTGAATELWWRSDSARVHVKVTNRARADRPRLTSERVAKLTQGGIDDPTRDEHSTGIGLGSSTYSLRALGGDVVLAQIGDVVSCVLTLPVKDVDCSLPMPANPTSSGGTSLLLSSSLMPPGSPLEPPDESPPESLVLTPRTTSTLLTHPTTKTPRLDDVPLHASPVGVPVDTSEDAAAIPCGLSDAQTSASRLRVASLSADEPPSDAPSPPWAITELESTSPLSPSSLIAVNPPACIPQAQSTAPTGLSSCSAEMAAPRPQSYEMSVPSCATDVRDGASQLPELVAPRPLTLAPIAPSAEKPTLSPTTQIVTLDDSPMITRMYVPPGLPHAAFL